MNIIVEQLGVCAQTPVVFRELVEPVEQIKQRRDEMQAFVDVGALEAGAAFFTQATYGCANHEPHDAHYNAT